MKKIYTSINDVFILEPDFYSDQRGWFMEEYMFDRYSKLGVNTCFVQDNISFSKKRGTFRGFHWQNDPMAQAKLVTVIKGAVIDFAIDLRKNSPSYLEHVEVELNDINKRQLFIPKGFAHGFLTITDDVIFFYKEDNCFSKIDEGGLRYSDTAININLNKYFDSPNLIISEKDKTLPFLKDINCNFEY